MTTPSTEATGAIMSAPLLRRLWQYQAERFSLVAYTPLVVAAVVAAVSVSVHARRVRGDSPEPVWPDPLVWVLGGLTVLVFFLGLRLLDEHKDVEIDRQARPELPVPRGLVTLAELRRTGLVLLGLVVLGHLVLAPVLLLAVGVVALWAALMTREFFVPRWLQARPAIYMTSHMVIMPLILGYATALDWLVVGARPPAVLLPFLIAAFLAGVVIEVGRKIRLPEEEREGVGSYTRDWGLRRAPLVWLLALAGSAVAAIWAGVHTGAGNWAALLLGIVLVAAALPAVAFIRAPTPRARSGVETASGVWTLALYVVLAAGPFVSGWLDAGVGR